MKEQHILANRSLKMIFLATGYKTNKICCRTKILKRFKSCKKTFTPSRVSADDIFSRFKGLKLSECFSEFNFLKRRGYDFRMVLTVPVSNGSQSDKTVNSYPTSPTGEGSIMSKDLFYSPKNSSFISCRMIMWHLVHHFLKVTTKDSNFKL